MYRNTDCAIRRAPVAVALHPEGVDRNIFGKRSGRLRDVALHPEGVDRNIIGGIIYMVIEVALPPEGVDRNETTSNANFIPPPVALHPEGVDRNLRQTCLPFSMLRSPSTRRAWIEISRSHR